jgi:hypothetical protein
MRSLSKSFVVTVGLLLIGVLSSSVRANDSVIGSFTLPHPTQWNNAVLPAGNYTFSLTRGLGETKVLSVHGAQQDLKMVYVSPSACETCRKGALKVAVQNDNRVVTSLELPGFHVNFNNRHSVSEREEQLAKTPATSEQVAVHVATN